MYKAAPPFGNFGSRRAALQELQKQLVVLEGLAARAQRTNDHGPFLAGGPQPTLADCTVFPTLVFCAFMLPRFDLDPWQGAPILKAYWQHMTERDPVGQVNGGVDIRLSTARLVCIFFVVWIAF